MPSFLMGWYGYAAAAILAALLAASGTFYVTSLGYRLTISNMQRVEAEKDSAAAQKSLASFTAMADHIADAANAYTTFKTDLDHRFSAIATDLNHAINAKPLPADCKPDTDRMRSLNAAIDAANSEAGQQPLPAVPGTH